MNQIYNMAKNAINESYQTSSKLKVWKELKQLSIYHMTICKIESK